MIRSRSSALCFVAACFLPSALVASQEGTGSMPTPTISLQEAVANTLLYDPDIQTAREVVNQREAEWIETKGVFDQAAGAGIDFSFDRKELFGNGLQREKDRRLRFFIASKELNRAADDIQAGFPTAGSLFLDNCLPGQTRFIITNLPNQQDITLCLNSSTSQVEGIVGNFTDLNGNSVNFSNLSLIGIFELLDELGAPISDAARDQVEFYTDIMRLIARQLRITANALAIARARLGDLPEEQQNLQLNLDLGHQFRFENGLSLTSTISMIGTETNFADKPLSPTFGGSVFPNSFVSTVGVALDIPLGKGLGKVVSLAAQRAAERRLEAAKHILAFTELDSALTTVSAYWNLAAAQAALELQELSVGYQKQFLDKTRELVEADELTRSEIDRAAANYTRGLSEAAAFRRSIVENRLALFQAMGLTSDRLDEMPLAASSLPDGNAGLKDDAERLFREALGSRRDLAAADQTTLASKILSKGAERNLLRQFDLSMNVSYSGIHESLDDRLYDLSGYWKAFTGSNYSPPRDPEREPLPDPSLAGPSYGIFLRWSVPFGNNAARGRLLQAEASQAQSEITETNLEREIRLRIEELVAALAVARSELAELTKAQERQAESLASSAELFKAGEISLIDTLTTEGQLTTARLALVGAQLTIAQLEAQLRFEAGRSPAAEERKQASLWAPLTMAAF